MIKWLKKISKEIETCDHGAIIEYGLVWGIDFIVAALAMIAMSAANLITGFSATVSAVESYIVIGIGVLLLIFSIYLVASVISIFKSERKKETK